MEVGTKGPDLRDIARGGFTAIEMLVVLAIGSIIVSMTLDGFGPVTSRFAAREGRLSLAAMQARARAHAMEQGSVTRLRIDPVGDSVWIVGPSGRVDFLNFESDRDVDIQSSASGVVTLCFNPRGYGEIRCNSFGSNSVDISFVQGAQSAGVTILPLGMLRW